MPEPSALHHDRHRTLSIPRLSILAACILVALGSGSNYTFSAYAPQLGERLRLTHTQLNIIGIAGNIGVFSSAPIWGRIVDSQGPQPLFAASFVLLLGGYSGIRYFYDTGESLSNSPLPALSYFLLALCSFMTGVAGTAGIMGSVDTTAKTFPDEARASTTGLVLSGFGLSAFLFSTIAGFAFPGDTSSLLFLLTTGTAVPMILGFFFVHPIPLHPNTTSEPHRPNHDLENADLASPTPALAPNIIFHRCSDYDSRTPLLVGQDGEMVCGCYQSVAGASSSRHPHQQEYLEYPTPTPDTLLTPQTMRSDEDPFSADSSVDVRRMVRERQSSSNDYNTGYRVSSHDSQSSPPQGIHDQRIWKWREEPNIYGLKLWKTLDFWLLFAIFGLLTGSGLMYINNVGSISRALIAQDNPDYDERYAARVQAKQVTIVSLMNCGGRIVFGFLSDLTKSRLHKPRSYCLVVASTTFLIVQLILKNIIRDVGGLSWGSAALGFAYGGSFLLLPTVCIEYFGLAHFSENFGFATLSPVITGYLFSVVFGRTLDAHEVAPDNNLHDLSQAPKRILSEAHRCLEGSKCYTDALNVTIGACIVALTLSIWMSWREQGRERRRVMGDDGGYTEYGYGGISSKPGSLRRTVESG